MRPAINLPMTYPNVDGKPAESYKPTRGIS
jgi:hypothetical protein